MNNNKINNKIKINLELDKCLILKKFKIMKLSIKKKINK